MSPLLGLATALLVGHVATASAQAPYGPPPPYAPPAVLDCWEDTRFFDSLATGTVDYCRDHLRYVPGSFDCQRIIDRVCSVFVPTTGEWTEVRQPRTRLRFSCPDGPPPPVCRRMDVQ